MNLQRLLLLCSTFLLMIPVTAKAVSIQVTYQDAQGTGFFDNTAATPVGGNTGTTVGAQRRIALEYAISRWSANITGSVVIGVQAISVTPGRKDANGNLNFLASARPLKFQNDWTKGNAPPLAGVSYSSALTSELAGKDFSDATGNFNDIQINFNSSWDTTINGDTDKRVWYYGLDANPAQDSFGNTYFDFVGAMLHEFCHGLGLGGSFLGTDGTYSPNSPTSWDYFLTDGAGNSVRSMSVAARVAIQTSDNVYTGGSILRSHTVNSARAKVYAPAAFASGSSMSHFDETSYSGAGSVNELMTPIESFSTQVFGPLVTDMLQDMGYVMADTQVPLVTIDVPVSGRSFRGNLVPRVSGTATDKAAAGDANAVGILRVDVGLSNSAGRWFNWNTGFFDTTPFDYDNNIGNPTLDNVPIAVGKRSWNFSLPTGLPDGAYRLGVKAVDQNNQASDFVYSTFTIDNTAPTISFSPFSDNETVFDLKPMIVVSSGSSSVTMLFLRTINGVTTEWDGTQWITGLAQPLPTTQTSSGVFTPAFTLPGRGDWPAGVQLSVSATSTDGAGNRATATIHLNRTGVDTTPPQVSFIGPEVGTVLSTPVLPFVYGAVSDAESGIANVTLTFTHFLPGGGYEFWNGASWTGTGTNLPTSYNLNAAQWVAPYNWALPSGASLPNGNYSLQATATNKETPAGVASVGVNFSVDYHQTLNWIGGYSSNSWDDPSNWTVNGFYAGQVPGANDIAVIATGSPQIPNGGARTVYKLVLSNGAYSGRGTINTVHGMDWSGGLITGTVNVPEAGTLNITGPDAKIIYGYGQYGSGDTAQPGVLNNAGTATWTGTGAIQTQYSAGPGLAAFINTGTLHIGTNAGMSEYGGGSFTSSGTVDQTVVAGTTVFALPVTNTGLFQVSTGSVQFAEGSTGISNGRYDVNGTDAVQFTAGISKLGDGVAFTGTGSVLISGGEVQLSVLSTAAHVSLDPGITLKLVKGGTLSKDGTLSGGGTLAWSGGLIAGTLTATASIPVVLSGSDPKILYGYGLYGSGDVHGKGTLNLLGGTTWTGAGDLQLQYGAVVNNYSTFEMRSDATINNYGGGTFNNMATLRKTIATGTSTISGDMLVNTSAVIDVQTGILDMQGTESITDGSTISGAGRVVLETGAFTVNGQINGSGTLEFRHGYLYGVHTFPNLSLRWTGGAICGITTIGTHATLSIEGTAQKTLYGYGLYGSGNTSQPGIINNNGTTVWTGGELQMQYTTTSQGLTGATFNNNGSFAIQTDTPLSQYAGGNFINNGTVTKDTTTGTTAVTTTFTNKSTLTVKTGKLQLGGGGEDGGLIDTTTATLEFNGGTHLLDNGLHLAGTSRISTTAGGLQLPSTAQANIQLDSGIVLELATSASLSGNGSFIGSGTLNWTGGTITGTPLFTGATLLDISGPDQKVLQAYGFYGSGDVTGKGTLEIATSAIIRGTGIVQLQYGATINNHGLLDIQSDAAIASYGGGLLNNYSILRKSAGALTTLDGIVVTNTNTGVLDVLSGVLSLNASGNSLALNTNFTGAGRTRIDAGDITIAGITGGNGHFELAGGELRGGPVFTGGTLHWTGGTITGYVGIGASAFLDISGSNPKTLNGYYLYASADVARPGYIINGGTATWSGTGGISLQYGSTSGALTGAQFYNTGTFNVRTAALIDQVGGGTFVNAGTINLGTAADANRTVFNINAGFTQTATGTLNLAFNGKNAATPDFDQVVFGTPATLDGRLNVNLLNGYSPAVGDSFKVLSYASHTGSFASLISLGVAIGSTYNAGDLTLDCTAITAPAITAQPLSRILTTGQPVTFSVAASGTVTGYQWLKNNVAIANAKAATYTIPVTALTSAAAYSVKVTNSFGSTTSSAAKLAIVGLPAAPVTVNQGLTITNTLTTGVPVTTPATVLAYQWSKDNTLLSGTTNPANSLGTMTGTANSKLSLTKALGGNTGAYTCKVTMADPASPTGSVSLTSGAFNVTVKLKPVVDAFAPGDWIVSGIVHDVITAANDPVSFKVVGLPTGITVSSDGHLHGEPTLNLTTSANYPLTITATNAAGTSDAYTVTATVQPLQAGVLGVYNGLVDRDPVLSSGYGGSLNIAIVTIGTMTGKITLGGLSYPFTNVRIDAVAGENPTGTVLIVRKAPLHNLTLSFAIDIDSGELAGFVTDGTATAPVQAWRKPWNGTTIKAPQAAVFTAVLEPDASLVGTSTTASNIDYPQGRGFATVTVTAAGAVTWAGKTADGFAITCNTTMGPGGQIPLHAMPYATAIGSIHGWNSASTDSVTQPVNNHLRLLDGTVDWNKSKQPDTAKDLTYKAGITLHTLTVIGGEYVKPATGKVVLGLTDGGAGHNDAKLTFSEGGLLGPTVPTTNVTAFVPAVNAAAPNKAFRIAATTQALTLPTAANNPAGLTFNLTSATGVFSGAFTLKGDPDPTHPATLLNRSVSYNGLLVQRLSVNQGVGVNQGVAVNQGVGYFLLAKLPENSTPKTTLATSKQFSGNVVLDAAP